VSKGGFIFLDQDANGECIPTSGAGDILEETGHTISFGQSSLFSCSQKLDAAELKAKCEAGIHGDFTIFSQIQNNLNYVSRLGSANVLNSKDWIKILKPTAEKLAESTWDDATKTCTGIIGYNLVFLTSSLGFTHNLQKYIVGAEVQPIKTSWTHFSADAATKQPFMHSVYLSFHEMLPQELLESS